jgi:hypothetical protein
VREVLVSQGRLKFRRKRMQNEGQGNLDKLVEEQTKQIYDLYQSKSKSFQNTFRILFSFALLFLFIILIPFISIKIINHRIIDRQKELPILIQQREEIIKTYQQAKSAIDGLHRDINRGPENLREYLGSLQSQMNQPELQQQENLNIEQSIQMPIQQSETRRDETWRKTQIVQRVQNQFDEYQKTLRESVIKPLQAIDKKDLVVFDIAAIEAGLDTLQIAFSEELEQNPEFWRMYTGKLNFYGGLDDKINRFWEIHGSGIEKQSQVLNEEIIRFQKANAEFDSMLVELKTRETQVASRLNQIEFPFGKLPIGLSESIAVFPIILAIGFLMLALLLRDTIQLRKSFHLLYQRKDPNQEILTDEQIMLIAPLWIDPLQSERKNWLARIILFVPFLIFLVSCIMILYSWTIPGFLRLGETLNWWLYGGMFSLSFLLFIYGYRQIARELQLYKEHEA